MINDPANAFTALEAMLSAQSPSVVAAALANTSPTNPDTTVPTPQPGECWLLRWDDTIALVVITRAFEEHLLVMPINVDPSAADETALVIPGTHAGFARDVAVFAMLETGIGPWVLYRPVTTLLTTDQVGQVRTWMRQGDAAALPKGWRTGTPTRDDAHPRRMARHELADRIAALGEADWMEPAWSRHPDEQPASIGQVSLREIAAALGGPAQRALAIARGDVTATAEEQEKLRAAGIPLPKAPQPPVDVIAELDSPTQKVALLTIATLRGTGEGPTRVTLAQAQYGLAARRSSAQDRTVSNDVLLLRERINDEIASTR